MKISVIVPVYNSVNTLPRLLDSLLAQSLKGFEIILINDGSTDGSDIICNKYAEVDNRIRVFHQINKGVAMARLLGINHASGKYSIHADSDDWIEPNMLYNLYNHAESTDSDIVICDFFEDTQKNECIYRKQNLSSLNPIDTLLDITKGKCFGALWNKLIKTSLYKKYNVKFYEGVNYCEDVLALSQILRNEDVVISYHNKAYYHYCYKDNSITHKLTHKTYQGIKTFTELVIKYVPDDIRFQSFRRGLPLGVFQAGFMNNFYSDNEILSEFHKVRKEAYRQVNSLKWLIGYICLDLRLPKLAKKLIKY